MVLNTNKSNRKECASLLSLKNLGFLLVIGLLSHCSTPHSNTKFDIAVPVSVEEVKKGSIEETLELTGTVMASEEVTLFTEIKGVYELQSNPVTKSKFRYGDHVEKGTVIIKVIDEEFENNLKIKSLSLNLEISKRELEKLKSLYDKGGVTYREVKNGEMEYINAQYSFDNAMIQSKKKNIMAPFSGVIVDLPYHTQGTLIAPNESVVSLMDYDELYLDVHFSENDLHDIRVGQRAYVTNYDLPNDTLRGYVSQLSPVVDVESRSVKGRLVVRNPSLLLKPGMFVNIAVIKKNKDDVFIVPKHALIDGDEDQVAFLIENGLANEIKVITGLENDTHVEVVEGIKNINQLIVVKGKETLKDGSTVKIVK